MEFGAPGIDVDVAWLEGATTTATGNSFATPHVAGLVTRILGKHPGLTVFQVKTILRALAANVRRDRGDTDGTSGGADTREDTPKLPDDPGRLGGSGGGG